MDCIICYGPIRRKTFWQCPTCNNKLHLACHNKWAVYSDACPYCRHSPEEEDKSWNKICCCFLLMSCLGQVFGTDQHTN